MGDGGKGLLGMAENTDGPIRTPPSQPVPDETLSLSPGRSEGLVARTESS